MQPAGSETERAAERAPTTHAIWYPDPVHKRLSGPSSASRVALAIEDAIALAGWREGEIYASLDDISRQYGVGRYVTHEAVRILQIRGACHLKRGPGGGIVVASPTLIRTGLAFATGIRHGGGTVRDLFDAREALDETVLRMGVERAGPKARAAFQTRLEGWKTCTDYTCADSLRAHYILRMGIAELTGNPALALFTRSLTMLSVGLATSIGNQAIADLLEDFDPAIVAAMGPGAMDASRQTGLDHAVAVIRAIDAEVALVCGPETKLDTLVRLDATDPRSPHSSRAIQLARRITNDITNGRWAVGGRIGSEDELCEMYGVGQATVRQAVRLLEEYEMAVSRPGKNHGLYCSPNLSLAPATRMATNFFAARRLSETDRTQAMSLIEQALLRLAEQRASAPERAALGEPDAPIGEIARSPVLEALWRALTASRMRAVAHNECQRSTNRLT